MTLWKQMGASIDMLDNAIKLCPVKVWTGKTKFWYLSYHTIFWLDYYLSRDPENFHPQAPYDLSEFDPSGKIPDRVYTQEEMLHYLDSCRRKCFDYIVNLDEADFDKRFKNENKDYSLFEILLYNMRHVQHHAGQLNLLLRQEINNSTPWVSRANILS